MSSELVQIKLIVLDIVDWVNETNELSSGAISENGLGTLFWISIDTVLD